MGIKNDAENIRQKLENEKLLKVKVALFGQPGAGKSSLINKLCGAKVADVGVETDRTKDAQSYEHNGIIFGDLPGYGTSLFPKETFFEKFSILDYDLFLCVTSGKLHQADTEFFNSLKSAGKICIFVVNKHDELWEEGVTTETLEVRKIEDIRKNACEKVDIVFTSCRDGSGIDKLSEEITGKLKDAKKERWVRGAKAYTVEVLNNKKEFCKRYLVICAAASAANALNPIPGADVAVDVGILFKLFAEIRSAYGLTDDHLAYFKGAAIPTAATLASNIVEYATKEGIVFLLKSYAGKEIAKMFLKYIPFVGQAIAATLGYMIAVNAGGYYLEECHQLAEFELKQRTCI